MGREARIRKVRKYVVPSTKEPRMTYATARELQETATLEQRAAAIGITLASTIVPHDS